MSHGLPNPLRQAPARAGEGDAGSEKPIDSSWHSVQNTLCLLSPLVSAERHFDHTLLVRESYLWTHLPHLCV